MTAGGIWPLWLSLAISSALAKVSWLVDEPPILGRVWQVGRMFERGDRTIVPRKKLLSQKAGLFAGR